jgi:hypothetical protein
VPARGPHQWAKDGKGRAIFGAARRASRCRASDDMWLQAAAAAIGALQLEDIEEQRGLFDGEEAVSEGERDAHGARLSELQRAANRRRTSMHQVVYRSCVSRVLRCPCHPCVHAILCPCHPCVHVIPVSMPSLCPCHSIAYVMPCGACVQGAWGEREADSNRRRRGLIDVDRSEHARQLSPALPSGV